MYSSIIFVTIIDCKQKLKFKFNNGNPEAPGTITSPLTTGTNVSVRRTQRTTIKRSPISDYPGRLFAEVRRRMVKSRAGIFIQRHLFFGVLKRWLVSIKCVLQGDTDYFKVIFFLHFLTNLK